MGYAALSRLLLFFVAFMAFHWSAAQILVTPLAERVGGQLVKSRHGMRLGRRLCFVTGEAELLLHLGLVPVMIEANFPLGRIKDKKSFICYRIFSYGKIVFGPGR